MQSRRLMQKCARLSAGALTSSRLFRERRIRFGFHIAPVIPTFVANAVNHFRMVVRRSPPP
jgi:hypothetical protein